MSDFLSKNYFELFGLPLSYRIDLNELRDRFREVQKAVHPDKFSADTDQSKRLAMQYAAHANQAFQVLKDPVARGFSLLEILGHECAPESSTIKDPMFLMEQMELRERMEHASDISDIEGLCSEVDEKVLSLEDEVNSCLQAAATSDELAKAELVLNKMQFFNKLLAEIEEKL